MNIFEYDGEEFDKKVDEVFGNINANELKRELIECGLVDKVRDYMKDIDNNKPVNIIISTTIVFCEEPSKKDTWGSNDISYELYYRTKDGILDVFEIGAFGDGTLVKRFQDRRNRGIALDEMLENIQEIKDMTYKEFKEKVLGG